MATPTNSARVPTPSIRRRSEAPRPPASSAAGQRWRRRWPMAARAMTGGAARGGARGACAPSRTAAIGGTRVARIAGTTPASSVTSVPDQQRDDDRARGEDRVALRQCEAQRVEQGGEALRERRGPRPRPTSEAAKPMIAGLGDDRAHHLPARGAQGAQRRQLAGALGDRDGQGVEDDEGADEERDAAEGEQEAADEGDAPRRSPPCPWRPARSPVDACDARGQQRRDLVGRASACETPGGGGDLDRVEAGLAEHRARRRDVEDGDGRAAEGVARRRSGRGRVIGRCAPGPRPSDADPVADGVAVVGRGAGVDHDLVRPGAPSGRRRASAG